MIAHHGDELRYRPLRAQPICQPPLDGTLRPLFERWYPGLANDNPVSAGQAAAA